MAVRPFRRGHLQGVEWWGIAGPSANFKIPLEIRPCFFIVVVVVLLVVIVVVVVVVVAVEF
jgi:hypothetical protein